MAEYRKFRCPYGDDFEGGDECDRCEQYELCMETPTANVISIPEGATNGDVIMTMFPNCERKENIHNGYFEMYFDGDFGNPSYMRVREYWWNAPYKRKVEE